MKEGKDNWSSIIPLNSYEVTILGNPDDEKMIINRYEAQKLQKDETLNMFKQRYSSEMRRTQDILKTYQNNTVYVSRSCILQKAGFYYTIRRQFFGYRGKTNTTTSIC